MNAQALRKLTPEELDSRVRELHDTVFNLKIKHATGQLENSASLRTTRRDLACALTIQIERRRER